MPEKIRIQIADDHDIVCEAFRTLLAFECQALLDTILNNPTGPNIEQYLSRQMNEDV
jgi:hypothetical protein